MIELKTSRIGETFAPFAFTIEKGKVKELAAAIGDNHPSYETGEHMPPTIATVIDLWGGQVSYGQLLGLNLKKVLYGEQTYEYIKNIRVGDEITVTTAIVDVQSKKAMDIYKVKREYKNQYGELTMVGYTSIIERH
ncbi:MaoC family dehydratase N-terminal domain-containing protein [Sporosarcina soli]|uniref:MaoC family dehydratase N-terminal domain-containing protein n=1 Tax=Sporosarcina soli TaxID=334736 RepID=A0ABW0TEM8_9BACL